MVEPDLDRFISADSHVLEPGDLWAERATAALRGDMPRVITDDNNSRFVGDGIGEMPLTLAFAAGKRGDDVTYSGKAWNDRPEAGYDAAARVQAMEEDGVSGEVLYPTLGLTLYRIPRDDVRRESMRVYNEWLLELASAARGRLLSVAMVDVSAPDLIAEQVEAAATAGHQGVMIPAHPTVPYNDRSYEPLWSAAADARVPVSIHIGTGADVVRASGPGAGGINYMLGLDDVQASCKTVIWSGALMRHPDLRVVFVEAGIGWLAALLEKMDDVWDQHRSWMRPELERPPSTYFRGQCFATFERDQVGLATREWTGVQSLLWATDFPHAESSWPESRQVAEEHFKSLAPTERAAITWQNVQRLYSWKPV